MIDILDIAFREAKKRIEQSADEMTPFGLIRGIGGNGAALLPLPWTDDASKNAMVEAFRETCQEEGAAYAIVAEAWAVERSNLSEVLKVRAAECADRQDVLQITSQARGQGTRMITAPITKLPDGRRSVGAPRIFDQGCGGLFAGFFDEAAKVCH